MIKQTEHFKNFNFNCFTYGNTQANCETIYITLLIHLHSGYLKQTWVLSVYRIMCLLIPNVFCLSFMLLRLVAFWVGSCFILDSTVVSALLLHWLQYLCTLPGYFGVWLLSKVLQIMYYWFSVVSLSFFLFFLLDQILDFMDI